MEPAYRPSSAQAAVLAQRNLEEVPVAADGDCLFASLLAMGVQASDGTTFGSVQDLRNHVAQVIRDTEDPRLRLWDARMNPLEIASQVATPRYWFGDAGDIMAELITMTLGIQLVILNANGSETRVGTGGAQYLLSRFNPQGGEHYHATGPRS